MRKLYPNLLAIDIVERGPVALWQRDGEVSIVSADGAVLDELKDARLNDCRSSSANSDEQGGSRNI